jgi:hypothetical protein
MTNRIMFTGVTWWQGRRGWTLNLNNLPKIPTVKRLKDRTWQEITCYLKLHGVSYYMSKRNNIIRNSMEFVITWGMITCYRARTEGTLKRTLFLSLFPLSLSQHTHKSPRIFCQSIVTYVALNW